MARGDGLGLLGDRRPAGRTARRSRTRPGSAPKQRQRRRERVRRGRERGVRPRTGGGSRGRAGARCSFNSGRWSASASRPGEVREGAAGVGQHPADAGVPLQRPAEHQVERGPRRVDGELDQELGPPQPQLARSPAARSGAPARSSGAGPTRPSPPRTGGRRGRRRRRSPAAAARPGAACRARARSPPARRPRRATGARPAPRTAPARRRGRRARYSLHSRASARAATASPKKTPGDDTDSTAAATPPASIDSATRSSDPSGSGSPPDRAWPRAASAST